MPAQPIIDLDADITTTDIDTDLDAIRQLPAVRSLPDVPEVVILKEHRALIELEARVRQLARLSPESIARGAQEAQACVAILRAMGATAEEIRRAQRCYLMLRRELGVLLRSMAMPREEALAKARLARDPLFHPRMQQADAAQDKPRAKASVEPQRPSAEWLAAHGIGRGAQDKARALAEIPTERFEAIIDARAAAGAPLSERGVIADARAATIDIDAGPETQPPRALTSDEQAACARTWGSSWRERHARVVTEEDLALLASPGWVVVVDDHVAAPWHHRLLWSADAAVIGRDRTIYYRGDRPDMFAAAWEAMGTAVLVWQGRPG